MGMAGGHWHHHCSLGKRKFDLCFALGIYFSCYNQLNPVEKCLLDKSPVLDKTFLGEGFGLFVLAAIPDLPDFACKAELA